MKETFITITQSIPIQYMNFKLREIFHTHEMIKGYKRLKLVKKVLKKTELTSKTTDAKEKNVIAQTVQHTQT